MEVLEDDFRQDLQIDTRSCLSLYRYSCSEFTLAAGKCLELQMWSRETGLACGIWKGSKRRVHRMVVSGFDVLGLPGAVSVQTIRGRLGQVWWKPQAKILPSQCDAPIPGLCGIAATWVWFEHCKTNPFQISQIFLPLKVLHCFSLPTLPSLKCLT